MAISNSYVCLPEGNSYNVAIGFMLDGCVYNTVLECTGSARLAPGRKFRKHKITIYHYRKKMTCRNVFEKQKQRSVDVVRRINE